MGLELFSSRIKELRSMMGYTQKQFAEAIKITAATLSAYENNTKKPSLNVLVYIAERFTVSLDWLCGLSEIVDPGDKPRKYTDVINLFFKLEDSQIFFLRNEKGNFDGILGMCTCLAFNDPVITVFLDSWSKTYKLYDDGIIDKTIYTAWKDKIRKDFNERIIITNEQNSNLYHHLLDESHANDYEKILNALHFANSPSSSIPADNSTTEE